MSFPKGTKQGKWLETAVALGEAIVGEVAYMHGFLKYIGGTMDSRIIVDNY